MHTRCSCLNDVALVYLHLLQLYQRLGLAVVDAASVVWLKPWGLILLGSPLQLLFIIVIVWNDSNIRETLVYLLLPLSLQIVVSHNIRALSVIEDSVMVVPLRKGISVHPVWTLTLIVILEHVVGVRCDLKLMLVVAFDLIQPERIPLVLVSVVIHLIVWRPLWVALVPLQRTEVAWLLAICIVVVVWLENVFDQALILAVLH